MKKLLSIIVLVLLLSCSDNADKTTQHDAVKDSAIIDDNPNAEVLRMMIPELFEYLSKQDSSFIPANFTMIGSAPMDKIKAYAVEDRLQEFYPFLVYNHDSTMAVDLYSYNYIIHKKANGKKFESAEPDSEVGLIDFKKSTRKRLVFAGPGISFLDAKWMNNAEILIIGAEEISSNQIQPMMWKMNLNDSTMQLYKYNDTLHAQTHPYTEQKLKPAPSFKSI